MVMKSPGIANSGRCGRQSRILPAEGVESGR